MLERHITYSKVELRAPEGEENGRILQGYAAVYESLSHDLGGFVERVAPGAFDDALADPDLDVLCRVQHQDGLLVVGRTKSGTLEVGSDDRGLWYRCVLPDTQAGRDIAVLVERGDIDQSSFAFELHPDGIEEWDWSYDPPLRILRKVHLYDVAPVSGPAYEATTAHIRSRVFKNAKRRREMQTRARHLAGHAARVRLHLIHQDLPRRALVGRRRGTRP